MNNYRAGEIAPPIDTNVILSMTNPPCKLCFISNTDMGDVVYEWIDDQVENFSSARLAEILFWADQNFFVDSSYIQAAKQELIKRGHYGFPLSM